jgi:hypothetical protein
MTGPGFFFCRIPLRMVDDAMVKTEKRIKAL